jgi:Protein of unknown function (DUF1236)
LPDHVRLPMIRKSPSGAIALAFLLSLGVANAQEKSPDNVANPPSHNAADARKQPLRLSPNQKETIFTLIRRGSVQIKPPPSNIFVAIGVQVPSSTELYSIPQAAATKVPAAKGYSYTIVNDTLILVDPVSRQIVATARQ